MDNKDIDVLGQLYVSFLNNLPIPEWVATAFIEKYQKGQRGEIKSWNEVFGKPTRYGTGEKIMRRIEEERLVLEEVRRLKAEGISLNEEQFSEIGRRVKGLSAEKSKVKELLHDARVWAERLNFLYRRH